MQYNHTSHATGRSPQRQKLNWIFVNSVTLILTAILWFCSDPTIKQRSLSVYLSEEDLSYSIEKLINQATGALPKTKSMGLAGGIDGFSLIVAFPGLTPNDFVGVRGKDGDYKINNDVLSFEGHAASTSATITRDGFRTLLVNCAKRLGISISNKRDLQSLLDKLANKDFGAKYQTTDSSTFEDALYQSYIPEKLFSYIKKVHPTWKLPKRNSWHPKLFQKYMTDSSLVNLLSSDFDCNGQIDYALLVLKEEKELGLVMFLASGGGFITRELGAQIVYVDNKIEYVLNHVIPGSYQTINPDATVQQPYLTFTCNSVGVGYFKELYESVVEVFYWKNGNVHSCLIANQL